jgi:hypothetical protein
LGRLIAHPGQCNAILVLAHGRHTDTADRGLELDQRVSAIMPIVRHSLAVCTEISVIADGALVTDTFNVRQVFFILAKRTITVDSVMAHSCGSRLAEGFVNGDKSVPGMVVFGLFDTV